MLTFTFAAQRLFIQSPFMVRAFRPNDLVSAEVTDEPMYPEADRDPLKPQSHRPIGVQTTYKQLKLVTALGEVYAFNLQTVSSPPEWAENTPKSVTDCLAAFGPFIRKDPPAGGSGGGTVVGPDPSTDRAIARYADATGQVLLDSPITIADGATPGTLSGTNTGDQSLASLGVSAFAQTILDDADAAAVRATIGAGTGTGDVVGPASAVDGHIVQFNGTTGKLVKDGLATSLGGNVAADSGKVVLYNAQGNIIASSVTDDAVHGEASGSGAIGVHGISSGASNTYGVKGDAANGFGVYGESLNGTGVWGFSINGYGGFFMNFAAALPALHALAVGGAEIAHFEDGGATPAFIVGANGSLSWRDLAARVTTRANLGLGTAALGNSATVSTADAIVQALPTGKIDLSFLPDSILGQVEYIGVWDAATNTPTLANPPALTTKGNFYIASVAGTQFGISFGVGDWIISDGTAWSKVDNTDAVSSWNGRIGNILPANGDYTALQITNVPAGNISATDVQAAINELDTEKLGVAAAAAAYQPLDSDLTAIAALGTTAYGRSLLEAANAAALRTLAGLVIGTDVQAFNAVLTTLAGASANGQSLVTASDYAAMRTLLGMPNRILKTATETRTTSAVLAADGVLKVSLAANTKYSIHLKVFVDTAASPDFKFRLAGPASPTLVRSWMLLYGGPASGGTTASSAASRLENTYSAADITIVSAADQLGTKLGIDLIIHNGANAGDFEFQWAQNTSSGANTSVLAGSYLDWQVV